MNPWIKIALLLLLSVCAVRSVHAEPLQAGVARVDLTPPLEMKATLGGYGARMSKPATGVRDRVWAKALVLADGQHRMGIVTADVLGFPPGFEEAVIQALGADGWRADDLLLLPSHTHTSIDMSALNPKCILPIPQIGMFHKELFQRTVTRVADVIRQAARQAKPATAGSASVRMEGWNRNRRGVRTVDDALTMIRIDAGDGQPLAVLVNWTAHPTFMDAEHMEFSGDWPGHMQRTLEALIGRGVTVLYCNGAEGDASPTPRTADAPAWEQAERYGRELAIECWRVWERIQTEPAPVLALHTEPLTLPKRQAHPDFMKTGGKEYGLSPETIGPLLEQLFPGQTHCTTLRIGSVAIVGVPGEMAAGLGLQIKSAVREKLGVPHVVIGGLADEWISYMLAPEEYRKGGYEASVSFYGETLGPIVVEAAIRSAIPLSQKGR